MIFDLAIQYVSSELVEIPCIKDMWNEQCNHKSYKLINVGLQFCCYLIM